MNRFFLSIILLLSASLVQARSIDDIRKALEESSVSQVQEKVYVHTDNTCYFVGDTLWYKAYVVRADNLKPTDISRILYVELLSPDGMLVERQNIIVSGDNFTNGQFVLTDSLYSGYYEIRAYTRWNLNFNQGLHRYNITETWQFYNKQMALDYYRTWDGLYSRVIPVYSKPDSEGDYDARRMYQRPKTRMPKPKKEELVVTFFPEGGTLVQGLQSRVAFEAVDQNGEVQTVSGTVWSGDDKQADISSGYMGRGAFTVTPGSHRLKARFNWRGKDYTFDLPKAEKSGAVLSLDGSSVTISSVNLPQGREYGVSVLCRGVLKHFAQVQLAPYGSGTVPGEPVPGHATLQLPLELLPAGVNDLTLFDSEGQILADRLFFVSPIDSMSPLSPKNPVGHITTIDPINPRETYSPYAPITVSLQLPEPGTTFSVAVRDTRTDEPTYDDGNIMTSMLLSSELRGFIARPAYYFESNDDEHRRNLDLLMMVQGWRKYKWQELADTATFTPRYEPEHTMTVSGSVYKMLGLREVELEEIPSWRNGVGVVGSSVTLEEVEDPSGATDEDGNAVTTTVVNNDLEYGSLLNSNAELGVNHSNLKYEVLVEAEMYTEDGPVAAVQKTEGGRFKFQIPPFYGTTYLNIKAYKEKDSLRKAMTARGDKTMFREDAYSDFYVKRDMPFPIFTHEYNFYENHAPDWEPTLEEEDTLFSEYSMENGVYQLRNVDVKGRRTGRRAIDWKKPAYVRDAYDLYNDITDYGLSFGKFDMRSFPRQVAQFLFGNMGRHVNYNVDGRLNGVTYWRSYRDITETMDSDLADLFRGTEGMRSAGAIYKDLLLSRLQNVRVYTDYEPRKEDSTMVHSRYIADATVEMEPIADDGKTVVHRDRHIYFYGFHEPAEFYQPDYGSRTPGSGSSDSPADYRRTLYWNPNARADDDGRFIAVFYNNSKDTRIKISAAGVTPDGRLLYYKAKK